MNPNLIQQAPSFTPAPGIEMAFTLDARLQTLFPLELQSLALRLHQQFEPKRKQLLQKRMARQEQRPTGFLPETRSIREGSWTCAPLPAYAQEQRIELAAPATRKYLLNGLNSEADVFVAHFGADTTDEANSPLNYQLHLRDAVNRSITYYDLANERFYKLEGQPADLMIAPRPWFEEESNFHVFGGAVSAAWFDTTLFLYHNAHLLLAQGSGPNLYLTGIETRAEARLWREVLLFLESELKLPLGKVRTALLVEGPSSLFHLNELIYELRDYTMAVGCGCTTELPQGLEPLIDHPELEIPTSLRHGIQPSLEEVFAKYLIRTCNKRGILAIGCMGKLSPMLASPTVQDTLIAKFRADKVREAKGGFHGTRVEHPTLIKVARREFDRYSHYWGHHGPSQPERVLLPSMNQFSVS